LLNLGGWIGDVFDTSLILEDSMVDTVPDPSNLSGEKIKSFDLNALLSGRLVIGAPDEREVWHDGVEIILKSVAALLGDINAIEEVVLEKKWTLLDPGYIGEAIEIPFDMDFSKIMDLRESFSSKNLYLKHSLGFIIRRPWYTFPVKGEEVIDIQKYTTAPTNEEEPTAAPAETVLSVSDFGGSCTFDHGESVYLTDGVISGTVVLKEMHDAPKIGEVSLLLGRTDICGKFADDEVARYHHVHTLQDAPISSERSIAVEFKLGEKGSEPNPVDKLPPSVPEMIPSDPDANKEQKVEVRYWLRLLLAEAAESGKAPRTWWSTHPVKLLRAPRSASGGV